MHEGSLRSRWKDGENARRPFIDRARILAGLTLPYLAPDNLTPGTLEAAAGQGHDLVRPYQSTGGRGTKVLSAKMILALFPPQSPFYRYELDATAALELGLNEDQIIDVQLALALRAKRLQRKLDVTGYRAVAGPTAQHLLVSGNYLQNFSNEGVARGFRLDQYMVHRDASDEVDTLIVKEIVHRKTLDESIRASADPTARTDLGQDFVDLYTGAFWQYDTKMWLTYQEAGGQEVPESRKTVSDEDLPWLVLRMLPDANEHYGRSYAEGLWGDLEVTEGLTEAMTRYAAIASKVVGINGPGSMLRDSEITEAETGDFITGIAEQLSFLSVDKLNDMIPVDTLLEKTRADLKSDYLMLTPVRNAERVTAEEIAATTRELTEALGVEFAVLAAEWQMPLVTKLEAIMRRRGELPRIPAVDDDAIASPKITTGLDAIGRTRDQVALARATGFIAQTLGPEIVARWYKPGNLIKRSLSFEGIDPSGLIKTEDEVRAEIQDERAAQAIQAAVPEGAKALREGVAQQQQAG